LGFARPAGPRQDGPTVFANIRPRASCTLLVSRYQPTSALSLRPEESRYLALFRNVTADARSGFFNSVFWTRTILQASHSSLAIKYSLIAIGALFKSLETSSTLPLNTRCISATPAAVHHDFALRQYSKAIQVIRKSFDKGENIPLHIALISCIVFSCFESFHGDQNAAIAQIYSGMKLLKDRTRHGPLSEGRCNDDGVEDDLVQIFLDTANSTKTYNIAFYRKITMPSRTTSIIDPADTMTFPDIPTVFFTVEQARETWEHLKKSIMMFVMSGIRTSAGRYCPTTTSPNSERNSIIALMERCSTALQPLLHRTRNSPNFLAANATYLDLKMSSILFHFAFETDETYFDAYTADFVRLLDIAETVFVYQIRNQTLVKDHSHKPGHDIESKASSYFAHQQAHFAFDTTIIYPLFYVATRCRVPSVRRRAIALLEAANRREGLWDSKLVAKVARLIMEIEEQGQDSGGHIPEAKRVTLQGVEFEDGGRLAVVSIVSKGGACRKVRFLV
jgi:hypothetical protein